MNSSLKKIKECEEIKSGWKTTEFWMTIAVNVAAILATVSQVASPKVGGMMMTASTAIYAVSRAWAKK